MTREDSIFDKPLLLLCLVVIGWGVSWAVLKYAFRELPPVLVRGASSAIAGILTLALTRLSGTSLVIERRHWLLLSALAFFNVFVWSLLSSYGLYLLPSGRAALLAYTMPLWCVPLSVWLLREPLGIRRVAALILGLGGIVALIAPQISQLGKEPFGIVLMLGAAISWAIGTVLMKRWKLPIKTSSLTGWMLTMGGVPLVLVSLITESFPNHALGVGTWASIIFNVIVTFMICNWAWNRFVSLVPVSVSSLSSLLTPVIGIAAGALFLGERPGPLEFFAACSIIGGIAVVNVPMKIFGNLRRSGN